MREIKFRGKIKSDGLWEFGSLWIDKAKYYINGTDNNWWEVIPETVGQFTGLHDKNSKDIYEGDIVKLAHKDVHPQMRKKNLVVSFKEKEACFIVGDSLSLTNVLEIIGNIHEGELEEMK